MQSKADNTRKKKYNSIVTSALVTDIVLKE